MDTPIAIAALNGASRARASAEAREVEAMLWFRDSEFARTANVEPAMRRQVERASVALMIGEATGLSESQVQLRISAAETVRDHALLVWHAFGTGRIDLARVRDIAHTIDQLHRPESVDRLDRPRRHLRHRRTLPPSCGSGCAGSCNGSRATSRPNAPTGPPRPARHGQPCRGRHGVAERVPAVP